MRNITGTCLVCFCLLASVLGCSRFAQLGTKVDLFTGDNAARAAAAIKNKVGGPTNVIRVEMHTDEMKITIQSPKDPKDIDEYTFKNGSVTGPQPVQVMQIGSLSMTGDKYGTTPIDDIGWANVAATAQRAIEVSKLENAHIDLISMDAEQVTQGSPELKAQVDKEAAAKREACLKSASPGDCIFKLTAGADRPLVLTWRLFVEGPRGRKDFWADKTGKLNEKAF